MNPTLRTEAPAAPAYQVADAELIERIADGDESALALLYDRYSQAIYGLALRVLQSPADSEAVTVDVFWQTWRQANRYDASRGKVITWLLTVARTRAIDRQRSLQRQTASRPGLVLQMEEFAQVGDLREEVHVAELRREVKKALDLLPALKRKAIELAYFRGLSQTEIAKELNVPLGTIKTRMRTGLGQLRSSLAALA